MTKVSRWLKIVITTGAIIMAAGAVFMLVGQRSTATADGGDSTTTTVPYETEEVQLRSLTDAKDFDGEVQFGEEWGLPIKLEGTVTARHPKGTVVKAGEPLIWVDNKPAFFAYGEMPLYRELFRVERVPGEKLELLTGDDVTQLQEFLLSQGHNDKERLKVDGIFGNRTARAVKAWQKAHGFEETGRITARELVFAPEDLRIKSEPRVGDAFGEFTVSTSGQKLTVSTSRRDVRYLKEGARVEIIVDPDTTIGGVVVATAEVVDQDMGGKKLQATITPDTALPESATTVTVTGRGISVEDAVTVSVRALVALAEGGYAVEVDLGGGKTELRKIEIGEILDGFAQISGDVNAGDRVVVATS